METSEKTAPVAAPVSAAAVVQGYHQRTKHRFEAFAAGPSTLDWDAQPSPFRHFAGAPVTPLPLASSLRQSGALAPWLERPFSALGDAPGQAPLNLDALGVLLNLSFGITAWKTLGPDRWAVRANPSSGNLHPIEAYVVAAGVPGLEDGVYHYDPRDHVLSRRALYGADRIAPGTLLLGLSSVLWREAWKYGERAFRYCELDCGHAVGAVRYAAAVLGWGVRELGGVSGTELSALLGLDRSEDFPGKAATEREEPEILLQLIPGKDAPASDLPVLLAASAAAQWQGTASTIDRHPLFRWPVIDAVAQASRPGGNTDEALCVPPGPGACGGSPRPVADVILGRRSAQRFDIRHTMPLAFLQELVEALDPRRGLPWDALLSPPRVALVLMVHRVEGLAPGAYLLPRSERVGEELRQLLPQKFTLNPVPALPALWHMADVEPQPLKRTTRSLHCHQDIAASACLAVGMLARFSDELQQDAAAYRQLFHEAGLIGQALYLQAEARGLRGTGIGCYFDDPVHEFVGLKGLEYQSLYHFTVGLSLDDARIETAAPYPQRHSRMDP